jgi:DNA-binding MarR family transcriptional regulator
MVGVIERPLRAEQNDAASIALEYHKSWALLERAHRSLLDALKDEMDRVGRTDLTPVQALMLFNIGDDEANLSDLRSRGQLSGANASYNLKKLVEGGYVIQERCAHDRRAVRVKLTDKGEIARNRVVSLMGRHADSLEPSGAVGCDDLRMMNRTLQRLSRFWSDQVRFKM